MLGVEYSKIDTLAYEPIEWLTVDMECLISTLKCFLQPFLHTQWLVGVVQGRPAQNSDG